MKAPPKSLLTSLVTEMDGNKAHAALIGMGYEITQSRCRQARAQVVRSNPRFAASRFRGAVADPSLTAAKASAKLEEAMCALYAKTAKQRGCKLETAAILLNYSPAQIAKMRRAA